MSYFSFDITRSGLNTAQKALKVTQNNIANANTPGYAKEELVIGQNIMIPAEGVDAEIGSGSVAVKVNRIVDDYLIQQSRDEQAAKGYYTELNTRLTEVETLFNESGDKSMSDLLNQFFSSFEEASKNPEDLAFRQSLIGSAQSLSDVLNVSSERLTEIKRLTDDRIQSKIRTINELTTKIADINDKIRLVPSNQSNALKDEKDRYVDELSKYVDIHVSSDTQGVTTISSGNGLLVSYGDSYQIKGAFDQEEQKWYIVSESGGELRPKSGELSAEIALRNNELPKYEQKLNKIASDLITAVNSYHTTGYGLDNTTGLNFFNGADATTIKVNTALEDHPEQVALSSKVNTPGNADVGKLLAGLREEKVANGGKDTLIGSYQNFVFGLASDVNVASENQTVHENVYNSIETQRQDVQGVNIDEEMMNVLKFQRFYEANARTMSSIDKMFDTLLNLIN